MKIRNLLENDTEIILGKIILDLQNMLIDSNVIEGIELSAKKSRDIGTDNIRYDFHLSHEFVDMKFHLQSYACHYYDIESQTWELLCKTPTAKILYTNLIPWIISQKTCIEIEKFKGTHKFCANWEEHPGYQEYPLEIEVRYDDLDQNEALRLLWSIEDQGWKVVNNLDGANGMIFTKINSILQFLKTYE